MGTAVVMDFVDFDLAHFRSDGGFDVVVAVVFEAAKIAAEFRVEKVPKGAVIPFAGQGVPWGWEDAEARLGAGIVGRLLRAQWPGELPFKLSGTAVHQHRLSSIHEFLLVPAEGNGGDDLSRPTPAPPAVPAAGHRHRVRVEEETETGPAEVWPLHVSLLLIVKT